MTANELLAMLGRAWPRLLLYPGGMAAFALIWLAGRVRRGKSLDGERVATALPGALAISAVAAPWLGLALLPLPLSAPLSRRTDLIVALALLEWPLVLTIAAEFRSPAPGAEARTARRLAAALNSYPPLILATLALAQSARSFEVEALARPPDATALARDAALHWIGAVALALALAPALGIGPFAAGQPDQRTLRIGLQLRGVGLAALAALPWLAPFGERPWLMPLPALLLAALLWGFDRAAAGRPARGWARACLALAGLLLLALLWAAAGALRDRLA